MRCDARDAMREPMRCTGCGLFAIQCDARGLVAFARCRRRHAFDGWIFRVGFFWDRLNTHQCSYVTRADRRVKGLVAEWVVGLVAEGWGGGLVAEGWGVCKS